MSSLSPTAVSANKNPKKRKHRAVISLLGGTKRVDADDWALLVALFTACWRDQETGLSPEHLSPEQLSDLARAIEVENDGGTGTGTDDRPDNGYNNSGCSCRVVSVRTPATLVRYQSRREERIMAFHFGDVNEANAEMRMLLAQQQPQQLLPSLAGLDHLKRLHLCGHHLDPTLPPGIGDLPKLEELHLAYSNLQDLPDGVLTRSDGVSALKLSTLDLSGCTSLRRLPSNMGHVLGPTLQALAINLGRLEAIPQSMGRLKNLTTLSYIGNGNKNNHGSRDQSDATTSTTTTAAAAADLSSVLPQWTNLRRLYIGMNDLLETLPESVLPLGTDDDVPGRRKQEAEDDDDDLLLRGDSSNRGRGWHRLEEIHVVMDVSRTLWDMQDEQQRREWEAQEEEQQQQQQQPEDQEELLSDEDSSPPGRAGPMEIVHEGRFFGANNNNNNNYYMNRVMDMGTNAANDGDSDSDAERPYNPCNTILVDALTGRIARWRSLRKIHFDFLWMYGPFLPVPTANDRVTVPLTLLHPLSHTLEELSIFCGPSNGDGNASSTFSSAPPGISSRSVPAWSVPAMSTATGELQPPPPVPLVELVLQDIGTLVNLRSLSLSHCKLVAPPPPPSPQTTSSAQRDVGDAARTITAGKEQEQNTPCTPKEDSNTPGKPRMREFRLQCCFQFFTAASRACEFVATNLDFSDLQVFQLSQCHEALGDAEFQRLCTTVLKHCPRLVDVDLSDGNIFQLDSGTDKRGLEDDGNFLLTCLPPTLQVLELSRNPALCPSEHSTRDHDAGGTTMRVNRRNTQVLWFLVARFPFLGFLGRFNILFLGRLGENFERLADYYHLVHHLALNRARYRVLSGTLHATDVPVGLWARIFERSQRAYDDYPNHVLARNRKDEADAIFHLLRERAAEDMFPLATTRDAVAGR